MRRQTYNEACVDCEHDIHRHDGEFGCFIHNTTEYGGRKVMSAQGSNHTTTSDDTCNVCGITLAPDSWYRVCDDDHCIDVFLKRLDTDWEIKRNAMINIHDLTHEFWDVCSDYFSKHARHPPTAGTIRGMLDAAIKNVQMEQYQEAGQ